jgi:hypothetical protein
MKPSEEVGIEPVNREQLLVEYREAMESQRSNTALVYSWTGNILLILSTGLFIFGTQTKAPEAFFPTMAFAVLLMLIWYGMTKTFVFYIGQRLRRANEIERILGIQLMSGAYEEIKRLGWKSRLVEARSYVRLFAVVYILIWIFMSWFKFRWL